MPLVTAGCHPKYSPVQSVEAAESNGSFVVPSSSCRGRPSRRVVFHAGVESTTAAPAARTEARATGRARAGMEGIRGAHGTGARVEDGAGRGDDVASDDVVARLRDRRGLEQRDLPLVGPRGPGAREHENENRDDSCRYIPVHGGFLRTRRLRRTGIEPRTCLVRFMNTDIPACRHHMNL